MILEGFYTIVSKEIIEENTIYLFNIEINSTHAIFEGHFPDNPITPGVCMMQIIKDITESISGSTLFMKKCSNVKFMAIINPEVTKDLQLEIKIKKEDENEIVINNITKFEETTALKLSVTYQKI